ncbi:MAG: hypothetical protein A2Y41_03850 [Spirochaetes bacterium GWB1_36_13]|nr:MAG: hypothetical protein A2Y41_03850 [Spirochaetes bacterium GWB1_36_13]
MKNILGAVEAKSINKQLNLPNLHILIFQKEDDTIAGHCLDFDIWAYSTQKDKKIAIKHTINRICEMTLMHIFTLLINKDLKELYSNRVEDMKEWETFIEYNSINKTNSIINSINTLQKFKKLNKKETEQDIKDTKNFNNLKQEEYEKLNKILNSIQNADPSETNSLLDSILMIIDKFYEIEKINLAG